MGCCSSSSNKSSPDKQATRLACPVCNTHCLQVPYSTTLLHVKKPWDTQEHLQQDSVYYFCTDADCDIVYFNTDQSTIKKVALRTLVGIKELKNDNALACYCFDVTHAEARDNKELRQYVIKKTKDNVCSCESLNPSGRCCLKDFPK